MAETEIEVVAQVGKAIQRAGFEYKTATSARYTMGTCLANELARAAIAALDAHRKTTLPEDMAKLVERLRLTGPTERKAADALEALATHAANCERLMHKAHGDHSIAENLLAKEFARAEKAEADLAEARAALRDAPGHHDDCAWWDPTQDACTCWRREHSAALTKAEATHGE